MITRRVGRAAIESPWRVPPIFLLPLRARLSTTTFAERDSPPAFSTSAPSQQASAVAEAVKTPPMQQTSPPQSIPTQAATTASSLSQPTTTPASTPAPSKPKAPISESVRQLLPSLAAQPPHYATVHIHARPYLVTAGDVVRLPFKMPDVTPGDVLRLDRASLVGSRDFTLRGQPYVDDRLFECRAVVVGVEAEPMRYKEKTKRRNRRVKTVKSKHRYTEIAIKELTVKDLDEVEL